jgi:uncharacterized MAPEG superfamily protein
MTTPLFCLVLFASWSILLVVAVGGWRVAQVIAGKKRPNEFPGGTPHGTDTYWRLNRAHVNSVENLPIFGAVVAVSQLAHFSGAWLDNACIVVVVARLAQSLIHISSPRSIAVNLRFASYLTQIIAISYVIVRMVAA